MKVIQLGCGITGLVCAEHLARNSHVSELVLADIETTAATSLIKRLGMDKVSADRVDGGDPKAIKKIISRSDVVVNALPWEFMGEVQRAAAAAGVDYVDFCLTKEALEDFEPIDRMCKDAGITALTANGLEPGISNVLARRAADKLDAPDELHVIDGDNGIVEGVEFFSTWSPIDWIEETTIPAAVFRNGKIEYVPPLHVKETYDFPPPLGPMQVFKTNHDETFLLPRHIKGIRNADFRIGVDDATWMLSRVIRKVGLHRTDLVDVKGVKVRPLDVVAAMYPTPREIAGKIKGIGGTTVEVIGLKDGKRTKIRSWVFVSHQWAHARYGTNGTGYLVGTGGAIPAEMLVEGRVKQKGLVCPEELNTDIFVEKLESKGLAVNEERTVL